MNATQGTTCFTGVTTLHTYIRLQQQQQEPGTLCLQLAGIFVPCAFCCFCCLVTEKLSSSYLVTSLCLDLLFFPVLHSLFFRPSVTEGYCYSRGRYPCRQCTPCSLVGSIVTLPNHPLVLERVRDNVDSQPPSRVYRNEDDDTVA